MGEIIRGHIFEIYRNPANGRMLYCWVLFLRVEIINPIIRKFCILIIIEKVTSFCFVILIKMVIVKSTTQLTCNEKLNQFICI